MYAILGLFRFDTLSALLRDIKEEKTESLSFSNFLGMKVIATVFFCLAFAAG